MSTMTNIRHCANHLHHYDIVMDTKNEFIIHTDVGNPRPTAWAFVLKRSGFLFSAPAIARSKDDFATLGIGRESSDCNADFIVWILARFLGNQSSAG